MTQEEIERERMSHLTDREYAAWRAIDGVEVGGCVLRLGMYGNKRPAVQADDPLQGRECTVTVNLHEIDLGEGEFHVRFETREYSGRIFDGLIEANLAHPTGVIVSQGYVDRYAEVWQLAL